MAQNDLQHRQLDSAALGAAAGRPSLSRVTQALLLAASLLFFFLHFLHLRADFPNNSPWVDWSKYTDEGWYGDAAIRHYVLGHWNVPGDFNPAAALPVWPLLLAALFHFTGVNIVAARILALCVFGATLWALFRLMQRFAPNTGPPGEVSLAPSLAVFLLCLSPFFFVFERMAILEPLLAALTVAALLTASYLRPWEPTPQPLHARLRVLWPQIALGIALPAMVLTKTTAASVLPAVIPIVWHRAGHRWRTALGMVALPLTLAIAVWGGYLLAFVRPHFLEDYRYLFSANGYTGFQLQPLAIVIFDTVADGSWIGTPLYATFFAGLVFTAFARPVFFRNPLVASLLLWIAGYYLFLAYHNNLQPRYYLLPAVAITAVVALLLDQLRHAPQRKNSLPSHALWRWAIVLALVAAIALPDASLQIKFLRHPEYTFQNAAQAIARIVRSDPHQSPLILSISGSDLTLMTGLPSIDDDFGTLDLDKRVLKYRPGWYVAWNQIEDDKMDALTPLYHPVRVATFAAMDDPDRNQLILYRLDPAEASGPRRRRRRGIPRPLRTNLGQQPTTTQLQH